MWRVDKVRLADGPQETAGAACRVSVTCLLAVDTQQLHLK